MGGETLLLDAAAIEVAYDAAIVQGQQEEAFTEQVAQPAAAEEQPQEITVYEYTLANGSVMRTSGLGETIQKCDKFRQVYERNPSAAKALFEMSAKPVIVPVNQSAEKLHTDSKSRDENKRQASLKSSDQKIRETAKHADDIAPIAEARDYGIQFYERQAAAVTPLAATETDSLQEARSVERIVAAEMHRAASEAEVQAASGQRENSPSPAKLGAIKSVQKVKTTKRPPQRSLTRSPAEPDTLSRKPPVKQFTGTDVSIKPVIRRAPEARKLPQVSESSATVNRTVDVESPPADIPVPVELQLDEIPIEYDAVIESTELPNIAQLELTVLDSDSEPAELDGVQPEEEYTFDAETAEVYRQLIQVHADSRIEQASPLELIDNPNETASGDAEEAPDPTPEEYLKSLGSLLEVEPADEPPRTFAEFQAHAGEQELEQTILQLAALIPELVLPANGEPNETELDSLMQAIEAVDTAIDQLFESANPEAELPLVTPEAIDKLIKLLRLIGYEDPGRELVRFMRKFDLLVLAQSIRTLRRLHEAGDLQRRTSVTTITDYVNNNFKRRLGKAVILLVTKPLMIAQAA